MSLIELVLLYLLQLGFMDLSSRRLRKNLFYLFFFAEDEHDFVRGLKFPTVDASDSSEGEFSLKPKINSQKPVRKPKKTHPRDPAPTMPNGELDAKARESTNEKRKDSSSASTDSVTSSSAQFALNATDLHDLDVLDSDTDGRSKPDVPDDEEIQKSVETEGIRPEGEEKLDGNIGVAKSEVTADEKQTEGLKSQDPEQTSIGGLEGGFEVLSK